MRIGFGKYKGQKVDDIAQTEEGIKYLRWLVGQDFISEELYDYIVYHLEV